MKIQTTAQNAAAVNMFLSAWLGNDKHTLTLLALEECEPIFFDCDAAELQNCFIELNRVGPAESIKRIFQGDHFYRSDTGKCKRCWRHRPEIKYDNCELCDRCNQFGKEQDQ